jgi:hypothetical protein
MNDKDELSNGEAQEGAIELRRETYAGQLNVTFTRGFVVVPSIRGSIRVYCSDFQIAAEEGRRRIDFQTHSSQGEGSTNMDGV